MRLPETVQEVGAPGRMELRSRLPHSPLGPSEDCRIKIRFETLTRCSREGQLVRAGKLPAGRRDLLLAEFDRQFACLGDRVRECFEQVFSGPPPEPSALIRLAVEPDVAFGLDHAPPDLERRCPVCGFPTAEFMPNGADFSAAMAAEIRLDLPSWNPEQGLCRPCADAYRALAIRRAPRLPCVAPRER